MLDPGKISANNHHDYYQFNLSDHTYTGRRYSDFSYYDVVDYGNRVKQTAENYAKYRRFSGPLTAETNFSVQDVEDYGDCSPPLWMMSPSESPWHRKNHYRNQSPASKAQVIARGQRELMEMVSKMPESCYELSLKDLVERQQQPVIEVKQESFRSEKDRKIQEMNKRERGMRKNINGKKMDVMNKNGNTSKRNEGFLLKMVLPIGFGSKNRRRKNESVSSNSFSKVSPRSPTPDGAEKGADKEWWKKGYTVQSESESSGLSSNNESVKISSVSRDENPGCWSFIIRTKNRKNVE